MNGKFIYANGFNISQARKLFKFYFRGFFLKAEKNDEQLRFDIFVKDKIITTEKEIATLEEYCDIEDFEEFWNQKTKTSQGNGIFNLIILENKITRK